MSKDYEDVHVLILSWEESNDAVAKQLLDLKSVFEKYYNYDAEHWMIPPKNAHRELSKKINTDVDSCDNEETLLIVYYGGHADV